MTTKKKKTKTLDSLTTTLEAVVQKLRGGAPKTKQMSPSEFVSFATGELEQAAKDEPAIAKRRLQALKRNVDGAIAAVAKMNAEDTDSESVRVEVTTAFAPTGDPPMSDLTTASDQSSSEVSPTSLSSGGGNSTFAKKLTEVTKALETLRAELGPAATDAQRKRTGKAAEANRGDGASAGDATAHAGRDADGWPIDMASTRFLKGETAGTSGPAWGYDPDEVAARPGR